MEHEPIDCSRNRWNRLLLNCFWLLLIISIMVESLYLTITESPTSEFIHLYIIRPTVLQLSVLLAAELCLRTFNNKFHDYLIITVSMLFSSILAYIHQIEYLLLLLCSPVIVSIFYFHPRKLLFALCNTLTAVYSLYVLNDTMNENMTLVGLCTLTVMFSCFSLIGWGIILRGREMTLQLKSSYESNRDLLVKTIMMDKLVKTDALTEMYNHMTFHEYLDKLIEQHELNRLSLQLALIDIDHFKTINDKYGHRAGDAVLRRVAEIIRSKLTMNDVGARYGGEEFAVLFTDKSLEQVTKILKEIHISIAGESHAVLGGKPVTVSIGYGSYQTGEGKEPFFKRMDDALYEAKNNGRNTVCLSCHPVPENSTA